MSIKGAMSVWNVEQGGFEIAALRGLVEARHPKISLGGGGVLRVRSTFFPLPSKRKRNTYGRNAHRFPGLCHVLTELI